MAHRRYADAEQKATDSAESESDPHGYVPRLCSALEVSETTEQKAHEIVDTSIEAGIAADVKASGVAAGAVYAASLLTNEKRTQLQVAATADVSLVTVRDRYYEQIHAIGLSAGCRSEMRCAAGRDHVFQNQESG